jgi:hypothetical protein
MNRLISGKELSNCPMNLTNWASQQTKRLYKTSSISLWKVLSSRLHSSWDRNGSLLFSNVKSLLASLNQSLKTQLSSSTTANGWLWDQHQTTLSPLRFELVSKSCMESSWVRCIRTMTRRFPASTSSHAENPKPSWVNSCNKLMKRRTPQLWTPLRIILGT